MEATAQNNKWSWWKNQGFQWLQSELENLPKQSVILDVGAGDGKYESLFRGFNHKTVDFHNYPGIDIVCDITKDLPVARNSVDVVCAANTLEHINEPAAVLGNCFGVLKPGGKILITVPFIIKVHQAPHDYLRYTHFMLEYLLKKAGFENIVVDEIGGIVEIKDSIIGNYIGTLYHNSHSLRVKIGSRVLRLLFAILDPVINKKIEYNYWTLGYHVKAIKPSL